MNGISFIIPTFNNLELVQRCLNSIEPQLDENDKVIVVDDGSRDRTYNVLTQLYKNKNQFVILEQENSGSGAARNTGVENSDTEYIWFVDSDDRIVTGAVDKIKEKLAENKFDIIFFDYYKDENGKQTNVEIDVDFKDNTALMLTEHFPWNKLFKRTLFNDVKFPKERIRFQDHGTIPLALSKAKKIGYINEPLYIYDFGHGENISKDRKKEDHIYIACNNLVKYVEQGQFSSQELRTVMIKTFVFSKLFLIQENTFKEIYSHSKKVKKYLDATTPDWKKSALLQKATGMKYEKQIHKMQAKIMLGNVFKTSPFLASVLLYIYNMKK